ncbi:MAG: sulfatase-like hydrolase/transferase [Planctomycetaceae bacterium]|nr:sulfatase-like hydrolase/transferase [Planctomycetaceae bacterium]
MAGWSSPLALGLATIICFQALADDRPNFVFIYTDDQAPTAVGFAGNEELKTPHIDRIAAEGATLRNSFTVTPVCSPSRAEMMTSRYGSELGILDWINPRSETELGLNPNTVTWVELLKDADYATCLSGKWHLGTADRYHPTLTGYDEFMGIRDGGCPPKDPVLEINGHPTKTSGFTVDLVTDHALKFIREHHKQSFLASVHYREPHAAWLPTRVEDWEPYRELDPTLPTPVHPDLDVERVKRMTREYYASIASVDRNVGRILDLLEELGVAENTVVIYTSDHGYHTGHHALWFKGNAHWMTKPLPEKRWEKIDRLRRPNLFDQALRVPTAIRWPKKIKAGTEVIAVTSNLDWYPTILAMAGIEVPEELTLRGRNFLPWLTGESVEDWPEELYAEYSMRHGATVDMRCWRTPKWKYMIDFAHDGREEIYDLVNDPKELNNLAASGDSQAAQIRKSFKEKILAKIREIGDPLVIDLP